MSVWRAPARNSCAAIFIPEIVVAPFVKLLVSYVIPVSREVAMQASIRTPFSSKNLCMISQVEEASVNTAFVSPYNGFVA